MKNEKQAVQTTIELNTVETYKTAAITKKECLFIADVSEIKKALAQIKNVIAKNNATPILDCVKITVQEGKLILSGTDLENFVTVTVPVENKGGAEICVSFATLNGYLSATKEGNLLFEIDFTNNALKIKRDTSVFTISGQDPKDFPKNSAGEKKIDLLKIPIDYFLQGINRTEKFTGNDDLRPVMMNICLECEKNVLRFISTDAHKLAVFTVKNINEEYECFPEENYILLIGKKAAKLIKTIFKGETGILRVQLTDAQIVFKYKGIEITSHWDKELQYLNWRAVVPTELPNKLEANRKEMIEVAERMKNVADKTTHQLRFCLNGKAEISAKDLDFANESKEFLKEFKYSGIENFTIGFNGLFLLDCLKSLDCEKIMLLTSAPNKAGLILPLQINRQSEYLLLIMPVMLND